MMERFRAHDILGIDPRRIGEALVFEDDDSAALGTECLRRASFVVVRRARAKEGRIPVGVRGDDRSQRIAAWLDPCSVSEHIAPELLRLTESPRELPALTVLQALQQRWKTWDMAWGPTGSVGFEIATGVSTVKGTSDLDLVIRSVVRLSYDYLRRIADVGQDLPCAVDVQVETGYGGFALQEYLNSPTRVILRTIAGPVLVDDPWNLLMTDR